MSDSSRELVWYLLSSSQEQLGELRQHVYGQRSIPTMDQLQAGWAMLRAIQHALETGEARAWEDIVRAERGRQGPPPEPASAECGAFEPVAALAATAPSTGTPLSAVPFAGVKTPPGPVASSLEPHPELGATHSTHAKRPPKTLPFQRYGHEPPPAVGPVVAEPAPIVPTTQPGAHEKSSATWSPSEPVMARGDPPAPATAVAAEPIVDDARQPPIQGERPEAIPAPVPAEVVHPPPALTLADKLRLAGASQQDIDAMLRALAPAPPDDDGETG